MCRLLVSSEASTSLRNYALHLEEQLAQHGARTIQFCVTTLLGGVRALWPACTECIYAITPVRVAWPIPEDPASCVARLWNIYACGASDNAQKDVVNTVVGLLLGSAQEGKKNKPKAKMLLTDFAVIRNGDVPVDTLISYSL